jgi:hypothetical protein
MSYGISYFFERRRKMKSSETCRTCKHSLSIGNGDFICNEYRKDKPMLVIDGYMPTEEYCACSGKLYKESHVKK